MNAPICDRCNKEPKARYVQAPKPMNLCWGCFDKWRRWYFGKNYRFCIPLETLKAIQAM